MNVDKDQENLLAIHHGHKLIQKTNQKQLLTDHSDPKDHLQNTPLSTLKIAKNGSSRKILVQRTPLNPTTSMIQNSNSSKRKIGKRILMISPATKLEENVLEKRQKAVGPDDVKSHPVLFEIKNELERPFDQEPYVDPITNKSKKKQEFSKLSKVYPQDQVSEIEIPDDFAGIKVDSIKDAERDIEYPASEERDIEYPESEERDVEYPASELCQELKYSKEKSGIIEGLNFYKDMNFDYLKQTTANKDNDQIEDSKLTEERENLDDLITESFISWPEIPKTDKEITELYLNYTPFSNLPSSLKTLK